MSKKFDKKTYEQNKFSMFVKYETFNDLKTYYLILRKFFDQHKDRKIYDEIVKIGIYDQIQNF